MSPRLLRPALAVALATFGLAAEWSSYDGGSLGLAAADLMVGLAFVTGGMLAWRTVWPERIPLTFFATGVAWFLGTIDARLLYLHRAPLVALLLAYPNGRIDSRLGRIVLVVAILDGVLVSLARNDGLTIALVGLLIVATALGVYRRPETERPARARATGCAVLAGAGLAVGSLSRLAGTQSVSSTALLLTYEATLIAVALVLSLGLVVDRSRSVAIADLVVEAGTGSRSEALRQALARALGDPSLALEYRVGSAYVDGEGRPIAPDTRPGRARTLIEHDGEPIAALVHDAGVAHDRSLDEAAAAGLRLAWSNARLQAELRRQVRDLAAARRRIMEADDAQRRRLERRLRLAADVHLEKMRLSLDRARQAAGPGAAAPLEAVQRELEKAVADVHDLARGIHPRTLTELGLEQALTELAATAPTPVSIGVSDERFPRAIEVTAYFVCAEALVNVAKYAQATRTTVAVTRDADYLRVAVTDDGVGGADPAGGSGLRGLADRVEAIGGRLSVKSPPAGGTAVVADIPLGQPA